MRAREAGSSIIGPSCGLVSLAGQIRGATWQVSSLSSSSSSLSILHLIACLPRASTPPRLSLQFSVAQRLQQRKSVQAFNHYIVNSLYLFFGPFLFPPSSPTHARDCVKFVCIFTNGLFLLTPWFPLLRELFVVVCCSVSAEARFVHVDGKRESEGIHRNCT